MVYVQFSFEFSLFGVLIFVLLLSCNCSHGYLTLKITSANSPFFLFSKFISYLCSESHLSLIGDKFIENPPLNLSSRNLFCSYIDT